MEFSPSNLHKTLTWVGLGLVPELVPCEALEGCARTAVLVHCHSLPINLQLLHFTSSIWFHFFHCGLLLALHGRKHPSDFPVLEKRFCPCSLWRPSVTQN